MNIWEILRTWWLLKGKLCLGSNMLQTYANHMKWIKCKWHRLRFDLGVKPIYYFAIKLHGCHVFMRTVMLKSSLNVQLCGGSRARCSWAHGPVTSQDCELTGEEPRDSRRLSLTTVQARRDRGRKYKHKSHRRRKSRSSNDSRPHSSRQNKFGKSSRHKHNVSHVSFSESSDSESTESGHKHAQSMDAAIS